MDWDKLRVFHAVADAGSLTHAGETLGLSQSAVSRQIRGLEEDMSVVLFHRHARGLLLTEQGEHLFSATQDIAKRLDTATARIRDATNEVLGELRVTTSVGFGAMWLAPRLSRLFERYPDLSIDLNLTESVLDLPMREADVAIRMKEPSQADLIRRRLMEVRMRFYASETYIAAHGAPQTPAELAEHRLIGLSPGAPQISAGRAWLSEYLAADHKAHLTVNNYYGILRAVSEGLGVGALPDYVAKEYDGIVNVAPSLCSAPVPVYLAYPEELRRSRKISAFRDFLLAELRSHDD